MGKAAFDGNKGRSRATALLMKTMTRMIDSDHWGRAAKEIRRFGAMGTCGVISPVRRFDGGRR